MTNVIQKENEPRQTYLVRVAIEMLIENGYEMKSIVYDEAVCDALCLADELATEFNIE